MKITKLIMGMPVTVEVRDKGATNGILQQVFEYFSQVDARFSTYKPQSEMSQINRGEILQRDYSPEMKEVLDLSELTKRQTGGYFDIKKPNGQLDPSGLVKGWAVNNAALLLKALGMSYFYVEAGGDIQVAAGANDRPWSVGIKNPFNQEEIVKVLFVSSQGVATSGTYIRGQHIYNPHRPAEKFTEILSLTVIGPNVYEADRFATAAFAMGKSGLEFIERLPGFEGFMVDKNKMGTATGGLKQFLAKPPIAAKN